MEKSAHHAVATTAADVPGLGNEDVEQQFSHLPQPYRMICKIIELEIFDSAWLIITRKHPELLLGSDGKPICVRRNQALNNIFIPKQPPISPYRQWTSMAEVAKIIFGTSLSGELNAVDSFSSILLSSVKVFPENVELFSPAWIASTVQNMDTMVITICSAVIYQVSEEVQVESATPAKKGGGAKKAPAVEQQKTEKRKKCYLTIASMTMGTHSVISPGALEVVDTITVDLAPTEDDRSVTVDVYPAENLVAVTTCYGGCNVYPLPTLSSTAEVPDLLAADHANAAEHSDTSNILCSMTVPGFFDNKLLKGLVFAASSDEGLSGIVKRAYTGCLPTFSDRPSHTAGTSHSLGTAHGNASSSRNLGHGTGHGVSHGTHGHAADTHDGHNDAALVAAQIRSLPIFQVSDILGVSSKEMVAIFEHVPEWSLVDLHKPKKLKKTSEVPVPVATTTKPKGKKAEEVPVQEAPTTPSQLYTPTIIGTWRLPSCVKEFKVDDRRASLLLGLLDGSVTLWDLRSRTIVSILCQHQSPVTALSFCSNPSSTKEKRYLISGSSDGILCFHTLAAATTVSPITSGTDQGYQGDLSSYCAGGLTFRNDVEGSAVTRIMVSDMGTAGFNYPIIAVCYSNETIAVYDYETAQLLGQTKYCIQRSLTDPAWHPATMIDIVAVGSIREDEFDEAKGNESITEGDEEEDEEDGTDGLAESITKTRIKNFDGQYKQLIPLLSDNAEDPTEGAATVCKTERSYPILCCLSQRGIATLFVRDSRDINDLVDYRMEDIILQSYPCLRAVCTDEKKDSLAKYFAQLTATERKLVTLPRERISEILGLVDDRFPSKPGGKNKLKTQSRTQINNSSSQLPHISSSTSNLNAKSFKQGGTNSNSAILHDNLPLSAGGSGIPHLPIKQWGSEGKELADEEHALSARSNDSSVSGHLGSRSLGALELDSAEYGDYAFVFDPIHSARRAAAVGKHSRLLGNVGSLEANSHVQSKQQIIGTRSAGISQSTATLNTKTPGTGAGSSTGHKIKKGDPVLILLSGLVDRFK